MDWEDALLMTEVETEMIQLQIKGQGLLGATRSQERGKGELCPRALEGTRTCPHLDFILPAT